MTTNGLPDFREQALAEVLAADISTVRDWATRWRTDQLSEAHRRHALAVEQANSTRELLSKTAPFANPPYVRPDQDEVWQLSRILRKLGSAELHNLDLARKRVDDFRKLSPASKALLFRFKPNHGAIDESDPLWIEFCQTEEGRVASTRRRRVLDRCDERAERQRLMYEKSVEEYRLRRTRELMATEFALPDGRRVTWGDATEQDHRERIAMLDGNIFANIEAAARHSAALDLIVEAGAKTLGEVGLEEDPPA